MKSKTDSGKTGVVCLMALDERGDARTRFSRCRRTRACVFQRGERAQVGVQNRDQIKQKSDMQKTPTQCPAMLDRQGKLETAISRGRQTKECGFSRSGDLGGAGERR
jgi:hypothetical protein